mmetsp:Transcript_52829/g.128091  ORF Transcript_52829/g.128091 Transcript_52829/m.128091 type:complete len:480 (+) Transcript_52829:345-1784(+)
MSPVVGMNMASPPPPSSTSAAAGHHQPEDEWPALGNTTGAAPATGAAGVNTSTDSDWEMLNSINVVAGTGAVGGTGTAPAHGPSNVFVSGVQPVMSRARRSQTIATEQEAYNKPKTTIAGVAAGGGDNSNNVHGNNLHKLSSFGDHNRNQRTSSNSRPALEHCHSSPDLRYSYYEVQSIDMMDEEDNSSGSSSGSSSTGSGSRSGSSTSSGVMIERGDPTAGATTDGAARQAATGSGNDDDEASSSVVLVSGPPSVVTAATTTSAWSMASPAASKLSFKDAVGTSAADAQQQPHHRHHHHHHHHKHRQNKPKKKSKIVVVTPVSPASTIRRCSRSTGDLMSLGRMLTEQEAEEEEYQQMRYKNGGGRQQRFPSHFYPKTVVEDHDFDDHHGGGFGFGGGDAVLGDTDAEEFYNRKEHGKNTRQNGLKSRPDEAKRLDMILAKKDMQRKQQQAKQGKQKATPKKAETQKKPSSGKGRTRW